MADEAKTDPAARPAPAGERKRDESIPKNSNQVNSSIRNKETPIEELYDLSKPIPKVPRPDKVEHEKQIAEISAALDKLKEDRRKVQEKIDGILNQDKNTSIGKERDEMQKLRSSRNSLIEEKKSIRAKLDVAKSQADKIMKDRKEARSTIKLSDPAQIDKEIAKLQRKQETTSMSLPDEKKLIREIETLKNSKKIVAGLKEKEGAMDVVKEKRRAVQDLLKSKDKEIDAVSKQIDYKVTIIRGMNDKDSAKRDKLQGWFKNRDKLRQTFNEKIKERDAIRAGFREKNNAWYNFQRALRAQRKGQYEEERKQREEEHAEYLKKVQEEEAKLIPYEAEQALCEYLVNYLHKTYLRESEKEDEKKSNIEALKDDPFANFKPVNKKEEDMEYFGKGKGTKKRNRSNKKQAQKYAGPFTLSADTFEQFGLVGMNPPTSLEQVDGTVKALREKKEWYSKQPRGSVPTAHQIRKSKERAAEKLRQNGGADNRRKPAGSSKGQKHFEMFEEDFVPLPRSNTRVSGAPLAFWGKPASITAPTSVGTDRADPTGPIDK